MTITIAALAMLTAASQPDSLPGKFLRMTYADTASYSLYVPRSVEGSTPVPLVVILHGCTQDAADVAAGTRMNEAAEADGFIVAYPEQDPGLHPQRCWRWYDPAHQRRDAGEPALIAGITREVVAARNIDPSRVHIAGISAGGAMAVIAAVTYPDLYASVASHSGIAYGVATDMQTALGAMGAGPAPGTAVGAAARLGAKAPPPPALFLQGDADQVVHPANLDGLLEQWEALAGGGEVHRQGPDAEGRSTLRVGGRETAAARLLAGVGHAWSGGSAVGSFTDPSGPDATAEILRFFRIRPAPHR